MPAPKQFVSPRADKGPFPFTISYEQLVKPDATEANPEPVAEWVTKTEEFTTVAMPSAGALLDFGRWIGSETIPVEALTGWFDACLPDTEYMRFLGLIHDKDVALQIDVLGEVAMWLAEVFGDRPTLPSAPSPSGSPQPGTGPTAAAPSEA
jgi:hypothetical protein